MAPFFGYAPIEVVFRKTSIDCGSQTTLSALSALDGHASATLQSYQRWEEHPPATECGNTVIVTVDEVKHSQL